MFQLCNSVFYTVSPNKHFPISLFITSGIVSFKVVACARPVRIDYDNADLGHADLSLVLLTWFTGKSMESKMKCFYPS